MVTKAIIAVCVASFVALRIWIAWVWRQSICCEECRLLDTEDGLRWIPKPYFVSISGWRTWRWMLHRDYGSDRIGIFRNLPGVAPGRWGIFILGFEFGSRNPRDPVGVWLKKVGAWPW